MKGGGGGGLSRRMDGMTGGSPCVMEAGWPG